MTVQVIHIAISVNTGEYSWRMPSQSPLDSTPGVFLALHHDKTPIQDITYPGYHLTLAQHSGGLPSTLLSEHPTSSLELPQTIIDSLDSIILLFQIVTLANFSFRHFSPLFAAVTS